MSPEQASLLDDLVDTDIAAIETELQALQTVQVATEKKKPKRTALPAEFPRTLIHHEPENTHCPCGCALKRIGEDVSEKLDYTTGVFPVRLPLGVYVGATGLECENSECVLAGRLRLTSIEQHSTRRIWRKWPHRGARVSIQDNGNTA